MSLFTASRKTSSDLGPFAAKMRFLAGEPTPPPLSYSAERRQPVGVHVQLGHYPSSKTDEPRQPPALGVGLDELPLL